MYTCKYLKARRTRTYQKNNEAFESYAADSNKPSSYKRLKFYVRNMFIQSVTRRQLN